MHFQSKFLNKNEADIMTGAITLAEKTVKQIMMPRSQMFSLKIRCACFAGVTAAVCVDSVVALFLARVRPP
jgi:Mg2+/Co2+ transporter CorC